jgi:trehalose/maltose hydrolase-like predicted phosphorylase
MTNQPHSDLPQRHERQGAAIGQEMERTHALLWSPGDPAWQFTADGYVPAREGQTEAELAIGNGLFGARASHELPTPGSQPRTYVAGLFGQPSGPVVTPVLLSAPDWLCLHLLADGELMTPATGTLLDDRRTLDTRRAILFHVLRWRSPGGAVVRLCTARLASQARRAFGVLHAHLEVEQPTLLALELRSHDAPALPLELVEHEGAVDLWRTPGAAHWLALAHEAALQVCGQVLRPVVTADGLRWQWKALPDDQVIFTRFVVVRRGDDGHEREDALMAASRAAAAAAGRAILQRGTLPLLEDHVRAWEQRWTASDVVVEGDPACQCAVRFAAYHLLSAANPEDTRVSVAARGLTGDAYYGHVFWDTDIYMLPFYVYTWPEAARAMLFYRHQTLGAARAKAARLGYRGAFYAWESADTGEEATPRGILGPDGREVVYPTATQAAHISADVAYGVWSYWQVTGDDAFLDEAGAEILLETARFWASRVTRAPDGRHHICQVTGPDEYHEGVDDSAYTNAMARWNLARALDVDAELRRRWPERWAALRQQLALGDEELATWRDVGTHLVTGYDPATGLFEQFAGFSRLESIDLATFKPFSPTMDLVLGHERIRQTQIVKQADVVLLLALLWEEMAPAVRAANFQYYAPRCSQGSSLSPATHALVAAWLGDVVTAERYFRQAAEIDEKDARRDEAAGVHMATQGGLWQAAVLGFAGLRPRPDGLRLDPHLPTSWQGLRFAVRWRGRRVQLALRNEGHALTATLEEGPSLALALGDQYIALQPGAAWTGTW